MACANIYTKQIHDENKALTKSLVQLLFYSIRPSYIMASWSAIQVDVAKTVALCWAKLVAPLKHEYPPHTSLVSQ